MRLVELHVRDPYNSVWEIDMPRPDDPNKIETFRLFRAQRLTDGEVICGRATRVWLARKTDPEADREVLFLALTSVAQCLPWCCNSFML